MCKLLPGKEFKEGGIKPAGYDSKLVQPDSKLGRSTEKSDSRVLQFGSGPRRAKMKTQKNEKSAGSFLLRAEGFFCS
jgi:hypothetical protein